MPELPEVETVRRGLLPVLEGRRLARVHLARHDLRFAVPPEFVQVVSGQQVDALRRRGKYLIVDLSNGQSILWHLGMSGRVAIDPAPESASPHDHLDITTDAGNRIVFTDPRRFGSLDVCATEGLFAHRSLAGMGPEPLDSAFSAIHLLSGLSGRKRNIKEALLDQRLVAGLGNIYVCEALYRSGISPRRAGGAVGAARAARLVDAIKDVLEEAIAAGGSTLRDHVQPDGELGYFQKRWQVYGREGEACPGDPGHTVQRIVQSGRSTFFCSRCQR